MRNTNKIFLTTLGLLLTGCATTTAVRDPAYAPVRPVERVAAPAPAMSATNGGAIFQAGREISLFEDQRARRVGDILTIRLVEKTDANKKAKTNTKKANDVTIANPTLFGKSPTFDLLTSHDNNLGFGL
ncbi:MAG: flagellar basal body L-ring protein FlgH, partial [Gammaproteobacteria bacterium]